MQHEYTVDIKNYLSLYPGKFPKTALSIIFDHHQLGEPALNLYGTLPEHVHFSVVYSKFCTRGEQQLLGRGERSYLAILATWGKGLGEGGESTHLPKYTPVLFWKQHKCYRP